MKLQVRPTAESDLDELRDTTAQRRIAKKIEDIRKKVEDQGIPPAKAFEKRLRGGWHPLLQQRAGDYRIWAVEGERTGKGDDDTLYVVRILDKETQQGLTGVDINPDTYL